LLTLMKSINTQLEKADRRLAKISKDDEPEMTSKGSD
jgi:hypothetical protein